MKDIPTIEPKEIITTITNMKTGEKYKDDNEWKAKGIPESDIRKDVRVTKTGKFLPLKFILYLPDLR